MAFPAEAGRAFHCKSSLRYAAFRAFRFNHWPMFARHFIYLKKFHFASDEQKLVIHKLCKDSVDALRVTKHNVNEKLSLVVIRLRPN